jgi:hypothetical protein
VEPVGKGAVSPSGDLGGTSSRMSGKTSGMRSTSSTATSNFPKNRGLPTEPTARTSPPGRSGSCSEGNGNPVPSSSSTNPGGGSGRTTKADS